jgi:hypothetical protein
VGLAAEVVPYDTVANPRLEPTSNSSVNTTGANPGGGYSGANAGGGNSGYVTTPTPPKSDSSNLNDQNIQSNFKP